jgi:hypothetical protein
MWWDRCCDCSRQPKTPLSSLSLSLTLSFTHTHIRTHTHSLTPHAEHLRTPMFDSILLFCIRFDLDPSLSLSLVFILRRLLKSWTHCWEKEREGPLQMVPLSSTRSHVPPTFEYYLTWFAASPTRNLSCIDFSR